MRSVGFEGPVMMQGLLGTVGLNGMVALGAYWVARYGFRQPSGLTRILAAVILGWAWITVGLELLGSVGLIGLPALLGWSASGLGLGFALWLRARIELPEATELNDSTGTAWGWDALIAMGLTVWAGLFYGVQSLLWPVKVVSDGPIYHLYFAARWWKEGNLNLIATPFGENAATYFPAVGDLWFTWLMTGWGGDRLAKVGQAPFWLVSGLTAYALARRLGAGTSAALMATTWFLTSTPLLLFAFEPNVDMIFVAGYLLASYFFLRYALGDTRGQPLILAGLAAGGALGTKTIGVVFVPVLLALTSLGVCRQAMPVRRKVAYLGLIWSSPLAMAGFWYGRNLWLTNNPLYPLHLEVGGKVLLQGWYDRLAMRRSQYYLAVADWRSLWDIVLAVIDPRLSLVWIAALVGLWAPGVRGESRDRYVWIASMLAVLNVALYWLLIPYRTQQRFMLHAVGLAVIPLARLLDRSPWLRSGALGLLVLHLFTSQNWPFASGEAPWDLSPQIPDVQSGIFFRPQVALVPQDESGWSLIVGLIAVTALGAGSIVVAWAWCRVAEKPVGRRWIGSSLASLGLFGAACLVFFPRDLDPRRCFYPVFPDYYRGWLDLETRLGSTGSKIAYAGTNLPYYLMGDGLRNEVCYVNIDGKRSWLLHDYHREARGRGEPTWPDPRPGWDRLHPDYHAWLKALQAEGIQILVVARANPDEGQHNIADAQEFPVERGWADSHPESFVPLYGEAEGDPRMRIYRVQPAASETH